MKVLFGIADRYEGTFVHRGVDVSSWRTDKLVKRGIAYVPQVDNVFPSLTVYENLQMGGLSMGSADLQKRIDQACEMFPEMQLRMNDLAAFLSLLVGVVIVIAILLLRLRAGEQVRSRLTSSEEEQEALAEVRTDPATGWLSGWLYLAGFRASRAATTFCLATFVLLAAGGIVIYRLHDSGVTDQLADLLASIPGGVGNVMIPFAMASPWLILATVTAIPALFVRAVRRRRVASVDEALPLVLHSVSYTHLTQTTNRQE